LFSEISVKSQMIQIDHSVSKTLHSTGYIQDILK